jgi:hypothetical protein
VAKASPDNTDALFGSAGGLVAQQQHKAAAETLARVSESSARYVDAQQAICNLYLYQKPQTDADDLAQVSTALRNLQMRGTETTSFLLARADFYRKVSELAGRQALPAQFSFPEQAPDAPGNQMAPARRQLAMLAEASYDQYLKRLPAYDPDREKIVRQKFKVAPWRLF